MMTTHPAASAWLARVERLAASLPAVTRAELLDDLREHLDAALPPGAPPAEVDAVLARLGDPADVVRAAAEVSPGSPPPPAAAPAPLAAPDRATGQEVLALTLLVAAGVLLALVPVAVLLWLGGVVVLLLRTRWEGGERLAALALPLVGAGVGTVPLLLPLLLVVEGEACSQGAGEVVVCDGGGGSPLVLVGIGVAFVLCLALLVWTVRWLLRRVRGRPLAQA